MAVFLSLSSGVTAAGRDTPVLGYWSIRGLAEPIRLLHAYVGKPLEEHRWGRLGSRPHVNRDVREWLAFKRELEVAPSHAVHTQCRSSEFIRARVQADRLG